ncbi:MAG: MFS transporter [Bryobacteraceae bacterium]|nr:MFS transporter [Bryobacteraceae bacterium]
MKGPFANPDFRRLWIGQVVSEMGSRITREGVPLTAALVLGATPFQMSLLTAISAAAVFSVSLFAGVWVDRLRRKPILIGSDLGRALLVGSIPAAAVAGVLTLFQLYVVAALAGVLTVIFQVAYHAYVPWLVHREELLEANSKLALTNSIAEVTGPGVTGVLVQTLTAPVAMLFDALSFLWSAAAILRIRAAEPAPVPASDPHVWREIREGFAALAERKPLLVLAARDATLYFCFGTLAAMYVLFAIREIGLGPLALGITIAMGGIGNLVGALWAPRFVARLGLGRALVTASFAYGSLVFFIPFAPADLYRGSAALIVSQLFGDMAFVLFNVPEISYRQSVVPAELLGRVNASMSLLTQGMLPLGALAGGWAAAQYGIRTALLIACCGIFASSFWTLHPAVRNLGRKSVLIS